MQGVVKVYDPKTGFGVVVLDSDQSEVFLQPGSLKDSVFRVLRQGQRVVFEVDSTGDKPFASRVRMGSDGY
jgi:CspA family cold shock protein